MSFTLCATVAQPSRITTPPFMSRKAAATHDDTMLLSHVLLLVSLTATSVYAAYDGSLFAWHPILMTLSVATSFTAANVMKSKGMKWHAVHSTLQMLATWCMVGGMVVMWRVKEEKGRPHWWTSSASLHARLGVSAAASYVLLAGFSLNVLPVVKVKARDLRRWGPSHRDAGRLLGVLAGAAMLTGWYKTYYASSSKPALFVALAAQFVAACAWLVYGGSGVGGVGGVGGGGGGVLGLGKAAALGDKRFQPWRNVLIPAVAGSFRAYISVILWLIGGKSKGGEEDGEGEGEGEGEGDAEEEKKKA